MSEEATVDHVQHLIEKHFGLACTEWQRQRIAELLRAEGAQSGCSEPSAKQLRLLVAQLTVGESYFFRELEQINALVEVAIPELCAGGPRPIRILSAGCASGEEVYSLAIALEERAANLAGRVRIHGVDVNPHSIQKARRARYSAWALRGTPESLRKRWFSAAGTDYQLRLDTRVSVTFEERNLLDDGPDFWLSEAFDVIFCRNVVIHFSSRSISALVARFSQVLAPGGFLFLGHSEMLPELSNNFDLLYTHDAFYHRRKSSRQVARNSSATIADPPPPAGPPMPHRPADSARARSSPSIEAVLTLIDAERFEDALGAIHAMASGTRADPYLDFLTAVILSAQGRLADAERFCERLLGTTEFEAPAHYLRGVCQEQKGCPEHAQSHYRQAMRLDPSFAMPLLRLGLLDRRAGNCAGARQHLRGALDRFRRERPDRIRLFGGGFPREALLDLCRTHLSALGE
jgi:chemotaxis protein methyltransferase CheR